MTPDEMERAISEYRVRIASLETMQRDFARTIDMRRFGEMDMPEFLRSMEELRRQVQHLNAVVSDLQHQVRGLTKEASRNGSQHVTRRLSVVPNYMTLGEKLSDDDGA